MQNMNSLIRLVVNEDSPRLQTIVGERKSTYLCKQKSTMVLVTINKKQVRIMSISFSFSIFKKTFCLSLSFNSYGR